MHCEIIDFYSSYFCWSTSDKRRLNKCFLGTRVWAPKPVYRFPKHPGYVTEMEMYISDLAIFKFINHDKILFFVSKNITTLPSFLSPSRTRALHFGFVSKNIKRPKKYIISVKEIDRRVLNVIIFVLLQGWFFLRVDLLIKRRFYGHLWMGFNGLKALEPLEGEIFLFTTIPSTQLIETSEGWKAEFNL